MKKHINDKVKSCFASFLILFVSATTVKAEGPKTGAFAEIPTLGDTLRASERMVDVAYGKQKYDAVTSSMSTVHADELRKSTATSIGEALIGRLPGLIVKKGLVRAGRRRTEHLHPGTQYLRWREYAAGDRRWFQDGLQPAFPV